MQQDAGPVQSEEKGSKPAVPCQKRKLFRTFKQLWGERPTVPWQAQGWNQSSENPFKESQFLPTIPCISQTLQLCLTLDVPHTGCCQAWLGGSLGV